MLGRAAVDILTKDLNLINPPTIRGSDPVVATAARKANDALEKEKVPRRKRGSLLQNLRDFVFLDVQGFAHVIGLCIIDRRELSRDILSKLVPSDRAVIWLLVT